MELQRNGRPRVVITGMGGVTPLGDMPEFWASLLAGRSGIRCIETFDVSNVPVRIGGEVRDFDPEQYGIARKEARRMARVSQFALAASKLAVEDAGYTADTLAPEGERVGVVMGTTMGPHVLSEEVTRAYRASGGKRPNPVAFANCLPNMPTHFVSYAYKTYGPLHTPSAACASGTQAVGEATDLLRARRADVVIVGGVETILSDYALAGFSSMEVLAEGYENNPEAASRPFDLNRSGFVFSEGATVFVLETLEHALARDARIYAEVLGWAASSDAYHIAALDPEGRGARRCMTWALQDAGVNPEAIGYINAHGTGTKANDAVETMAIKQVFGAHAYHVPVSSTKSMTGHAMGASGAFEVAACAMALRDQALPPTINYEVPDPECDLDYVPNTARQVQGMKMVLSNSFGLGGQNASIVLGTL